MIELPASLETTVIVLLAMTDALLVALFFLFRILPWARPGPWRLIWMLASLAAVLFLLSEGAALSVGGDALSYQHQLTLFGMMLAISCGFILVYFHGQRAMERAVNLAETDELTQLANSRAFDARLHNLIALRVPFGLAYLDVDGLKGVNDRLGHKSGDKVLQDFAAILRDSLRAGDLAARLGGDEFAALLVGADRGAAYRAAERVLSNLPMIITTHDGTLSVGVSIGVAAEPYGLSPSELLTKADRAMYEAKRAGGNRVVLATS